MNLSCSSVDLYRFCPHAYNLRYVQNKEPPKNLYMKRGIALHEAINKFYKGVERKELMNQYRNQIFENYTGMSLEIWRENFEYDISLLHNFFDMVSDCNIRDILSERRFEIKRDNNYNIVGIIDSYWVVDNAIAIIDYKSNKKLPDKIFFEESLQPSVYIWATDQMINKILPFKYMFIGLKQMIEVERTKEDFKNFLDIFDEVSKNILLQRYEKNLYKCDFCDFAKFCIK